jgi:hypothetical protein
MVAAEAPKALRNARVAAPADLARHGRAGLTIAIRDLRA